MRIFATILVAMLVAPYAALAVQRDTNALAGVKTIYIEWTPTTDRDATKESLTRELTKVGFEIVDNRLRADATLTISPQVEVVVDGDGSIPQKSIFTYELVLPNTTVAWKHRVKFVSRRVPAEDFDYAAAKMAAKLVKDKEDSVRKGARK
jgi:hypothetical protein